MSDLLASGKPCSGRYVLFMHIHPEKEDHMDLMVEDTAKGNLICYNHPKAFSDFPSKSTWTFYGLKDLNYLKHSGAIRPGFGALNPVETGVFEINQESVLIMKAESVTRKYRILTRPDSSVVLSQID